MGASSRSPSPMTMVPSMGTESMTPAHGFGGHLVGQLAVALAHGLGGGDGGLLDHAQELQRQVGFEVGSRGVVMEFRLPVWVQLGPW